MLNSTEKIYRSNLKNHVFTSNDLQHLFGGSSARRHALVNKALKKQELIRLYRKFYILNDKYTTCRFSKYYIACRIHSLCYVSLESALAFHGWIPERVIDVSCITAKPRAFSIKNVFGCFRYYPASTDPYEFLSGVARSEINTQSFLIASPLRALMDLVYVRKIDNANVDFLQHSLRIELDDLATITPDEIICLSNVYRSKRILNFLNTLQNELYAHD